jgi:acyl-CoA synthetase (AMP-forming)/AMP-acid ligase II
MRPLRGGRCGDIASNDLVDAVGRLSRIVRCPVELLLEPPLEARRRERGDLPRRLAARVVEARPDWHPNEADRSWRCYTSSCKWLALAAAGRFGPSRLNVAYPARCSTSGVYCTIEGRLKDMIIRGGENIYPRELEDLLFAHASVAEVAVVGLPDDKWGETVGAFIRPAAGQSVDTQELFAYLGEHLAPHKTPKQWFQVEQFPPHRLREDSEVRPPRSAGEWRDVRAIEREPPLEDGPQRGRQVG